MLFVYSSSVDLFFVCLKTDDIGIRCVGQLQFYLPFCKGLIILLNVPHIHQNKSFIRCMAHKGKTQLTILRWNIQCNNQLWNVTTINYETQHVHSIVKHNNQLWNTTINSEKQHSILKHNNQFWNIMKHKQSTLKHNNPFCETQQSIIDWVRYQYSSELNSRIILEHNNQYILKHNSDEYWYLTQTFQWSWMGTSATGVSSAMFCQSYDSWLRQSYKFCPNWGKTSQESGQSTSSPSPSSTCTTQPRSVSWF